MFWNKKPKDHAAKCQERALKFGILSTKLSLILAVVTVWINEGPHSAPYAEFIFKGALTFFLIALACFFILALGLVYNKIKLK